MITSTSGKGSGKFVKPVRAVAKWKPMDVEKLQKAIDDGLNLDETCALFPERSRASVRGKYYPAREGVEEPPINCRQRNKRIDPADYCEYRFEKDAREGSAKLLQALIDAGFVQPMKKAG
jgi:hypothetical protein